MLQSWNNSIFLNVRDKLLLAAMKFLYAERNGEAFDSQLVVGVRESFGESPKYQGWINPSLWRLSSLVLSSIVHSNKVSLIKRTLAEGTLIL